MAAEEDENSFLPRVATCGVICASNVICHPERTCDAEMSYRPDSLFFLYRQDLRNPFALVHILLQDVN